MLSKEFISGFFEGEGCVGVSTNTRYRKDGSANKFFTFTVSFTNTNKAQIDDIKEAIKVYLDIDMSIHKSIDKRFDKAQPAYRLYKSNKADCLKLLKFLVNPEGLKFPQVLLAIHILEEWNKEKLHRQTSRDRLLVDHLSRLKWNQPIDDSVARLIGDLKKEFFRANRVNSGKPKSKDKVILSQAAEGYIPAEGAETRRLSPNNNTFQERPTPYGMYYRGDDIVRHSGESRRASLNS